MLRFEYNPFIRDVGFCCLNIDRLDTIFFALSVHSKLVFKCIVSLQAAISRPGHRHLIHFATSV